MHTGLSSAVAPRASLAALVAGAVRHGLTALELRAGDGHGVSAEAQATGDSPPLALAPSVVVSGYRDGGDESVGALGTLSRRLAVPIVIDIPGSRLLRRDRARLLRDAGATTRIVVRGQDALVEAEWLASVNEELAWDALPHGELLGEQSRRLLETAGPLLRQVGIAGGGPESTLFEGRGIGEVMARLALAQFSGTLLLSPSSPTYHLLWERWLARPHGWGCGSHASDASLVNLITTAAEPVGGVA